MDLILMILTALLIPGAMIGLGLWYRRHVPKTMRAGYRTRRSMLSADTWAFAHRQLGKYWLRLGTPTLLVSVGVIFAVLRKDADTAEKALAVLTVLQSLVLAAPCIAIERALKRNFDDDGVPYDPNDLRLQ